MKAEDKQFIEKYGGSADEALLSRYAYRMSSHVRALIQGDVHSDPIARQYIPQHYELESAPEEFDDPIGDNAHSPVKGIVHRYPDRVLFKPVHVCPVYCRYCFRREMVGPKDGKAGDMLSAEEIKAALAYIETHEEIFEVILTGGDPLVMGAKGLANLLCALDEMEHVRTIRIHSRVPIVDPFRVSENVLDVIRGVSTPVNIVLHVNHAQELSGEVEQALNALRGAGATLLSQSVLLKGVNDNVDALEGLFRALVCLGVKPYYIHHPDLAPGTAHFRLEIEEGLSLMEGLQGRISGLCLPRYMLDIPGGYGKVSLDSRFVTKIAANRYMLRDYQGGEHMYPPEDV